MDKILNYRNAIISFLEDYAKIKPANLPEVQNQVIIDDVNRHYQLVRIGWDEGKHVHYAVFHFDIIDGKVWIQQNRTDLPIGFDLIDLGIAAKDLVYAYLPVSLRSAA
ncbi:MAG: XisI protein [Saprospiraceae bacterium]|nr:XisI protein [Saprospiraceae bacterium]